MIVTAPGRVDIAQMAAGPERHVIYPDGMPPRRLTTVARPLISNAVVQMLYVPRRGHHARQNPARRRPSPLRLPIMVGWPPPTGMSSDDRWTSTGRPRCGPIGHRWTRGPILRAWTGAGPDRPQRTPGRPDTGGCSHDATVRPRDARYRTGPFVEVRLIAVGRARAARQVYRGWSSTCLPSLTARFSAGMPIVGAEAG